MGSLQRRAVGVGLLAGFIGLLVAVWTAHGAPATGYELDIYAATPQATWIGLGLAAVLGLVVAVGTDRNGRFHHAALLLLGSSGVVLTGMPVIRGYRYYGAGDALTHLGWAREIAAGVFSPTDLLYPGIHSISVVISAVSGVPLTLAMEYTVSLAFPLVFLLTVPLLVRLVTGARLAYPLGLAAALLFVPVNNISVHPAAHPTSQAILFAPVAVLLALSYVFAPSLDKVASTTSADAPTSPTVTDGGRSRVSGVGALLVVVSAAVVLIHPQQALNIALVFLAITVLQLIYRARAADKPIASHRWLGVQTGIIAALFLLWTPRFDRAVGTISFTFGSLFGGETSAGTEVTSAATSLSGVGGSIPILFVKLFIAGTVLSLVAGIVIASGFTGRLRDSWTDASVRYLTIALVPLAGVFGVVFVIGAGDMYFRYQGLMMVFITVLGAAGLAIIADATPTRLPDGSLKVGVLVLLLVLAPVAAIGYHASPYMYQPTGHVPSTQLDGYSASFEHRQAEVPFTGLRGGPQRYVDYYYGTQYARFTLDFPGYERGVTGETFVGAEYDSEFDETRYLAITGASYDREVTLYDGFRYTQEGFDKLETTSTVNRIRSNDGFDLYLIRFDPETTEE
ncbi:hypothetical protein [Halobaculum limi]|uniref:hypothetical protein n=1 Tax=Halobaculum limi TaxID=3031916 RepID=UPI002404D43B|nr:hypothetical protein [Halobaculum sp. YSMS11]